MLAPRRSTRAVGTSRVYRPPPPCHFRKCLAQDARWRVSDAVAPRRIAASLILRLTDRSVILPVPHPHASGGPPSATTRA
ncbi:hypothetical protein KCP70_16975 [Salmonella enterica subsp. enterica]|nr:hypothetical protein KCP70_16975 [Salmonella enterica subsp. enterica]